MQESKAYEEAISGLLLRFRERYEAEEPPIAAKIVEQSLNEFLFPFCNHCLGAKEVVLDKLKMICQECHGSGLKSHSDKDRAHSMLLSQGFVRKLGYKLRWIYELCAGLDAAVNAEMNEQLGRLNPVASREI